MMMTLKGLPLAYNKDMQEDKEGLFDALGYLGSTACIWRPPVLDGIQVKRPRCAEAAQQGYANATELADYLVAKGVPFREAHHIVGEAVVEAIAQGKPLEALTPGRSAEIQPGDCGRCVSDLVAAVLPRETRSERRRLAAAGSPGAINEAKARLS